MRKTSNQITFSLLKHREHHYNWPIHNNFYKLEHFLLNIVGKYFTMLKGGKTSTNNYLIKQLPKATAFINKSMKIDYVSDKWITDFDFVNNEVLGKPISKLFKNINENWQKIVENCIKDYSTRTTVAVYIDSKGNKKWFEVQNTPWYDDQENFIGTILQTEDITKTFLNEGKLEKLKILSEQVADTAKIGLWDYNLEHNEMHWSEKTRAIYEVSEDYEPNFIDTTNFFKNGFSRNTLSMTINKAIINEVPFREKLQLVTAKNNDIWVIISGKPLYQDEKFIGLVGTIQDINELNLAEIKSRENEHLLRTLIDNLPLNVFVKDLESRKILVNKAEAEYCRSINADGILGKDDFATYEKETAVKSRKNDLKVMRDLKPILGEEVKLTKIDGTSTTFLTSKIPLLDTDGHAYGLIGISMDISDLKRKELELRQLIKVTSSQNEKLVNFAHIVSHNLRSHSANFVMLLNFLKAEKIESEKQLITNMLSESSDNLMETLNNLNEVIDINTKRGLKLESIGLKTKIKNIIQSQSVDISTNNALIRNKVPANIKIKVIPEYIDSILSNFLTNSIKYKSPERDPIIEFSASKEDNYTVLSITDNGLGIDLKKHGDKLFGMYKTFHDNESARGIGLYITKNQIEAMKGKVVVTSEVGFGTTFKIYFNEKN